LARSAEFRSGSADRVGGRDPRPTFEFPDDARVMSRQSVYARSDLQFGDRSPSRVRRSTPHHPPRPTTRTKQRGERVVGLGASAKTLWRRARDGSGSRAALLRTLLRTLCSTLRNIALGALGETHPVSARKPLARACVYLHHHAHGTSAPLATGIALEHGEGSAARPRATCLPRRAGRWLVAVRVLVARGNRGGSDWAAHDAARCPGRPWTRATASFREGVPHR
jgi:hypothetical protein